jgi:hypothetical protein
MAASANSALPTSTGSIKARCELEVQDLTGSPICCKSTPGSCRSVNNKMCPAPLPCEQHPLPFSLPAKQQFVKQYMVANMAALCTSLLFLEKNLPCRLGWHVAWAGCTC